MNNKTLTLTLDFSTLDTTKCVRNSVSACIIAQAINNCSDKISKRFHATFYSCFVTTHPREIALSFYKLPTIHLCLTPKLKEIANAFDCYMMSEEEIHNLGKITVKFKILDY